MTSRLPRGSTTLGLLAAAALLAGCASATESANDPASDSISVVATTTILGSITSDILACADPNATVTTLMPIGADPHDFAPSSQQIAQMVGADLVVANGLGLEAGLTDALASAATDGATVLEVGEQVDPLPFGDHAGDAAADDHAADGTATDGTATDEHDQGSDDPHVWFDMSRMATAAEIIGSTLAQTAGDTYATCGSQVADEIRAAELDVRATMESVPAAKRILVTDHDALGYLSDAYGYEIAGTVIPGGSTLGEPSSADLAALVSVIQAENVPAIFTNTASPTDLADAVAAETGRTIAVVPLFIGSLGDEASGADTYITMMEKNASLIAQALNS